MKTVIGAAGCRRGDDSEFPRASTDLPNWAGQGAAAVGRRTGGVTTRVEQSALQIAQIILVIDEISFQTNLLALNAGLGGASLGGAGLGRAPLGRSRADGAGDRFALAPAEVRALARIADQVAQINRVISEIAASAQEEATAV